MPDPAPLLPYESSADDPPLRRPWWVYTLIAVYLIALAAMFLVPAFAATQASPSDLSFVVLLTSYACALAICGISLLVLPVRAVRRRPIHRRSIWFPIIGSGLLAGVLILGAGLALDELFRAGDSFAWAVIAASLVIWIGWAILFSLIAFRRPRTHRRKTPSPPHHRQRPRTPDRHSFPRHSSSTQLLLRRNRNRNGNRHRRLRHVHLPRPQRSFALLPSPQTNSPAFTPEAEQSHVAIDFSSFPSPGTPGEG